MAVLAILGEEGFIPQQIQEISFPDGELPNYPRDSYSEYPMHSQNLHDKLLSLKYPRWRLGSERGIKPPFFVHFPASTLTIR
jgi:hypothetical protein